MDLKLFQFKNQKSKLQTFYPNLLYMLFSELTISSTSFGVAVIRDKYQVHELGQNW